VFVKSAFPEVSSLRPNGGLEAGGTPVSITGGNLSKVKAVKFGPTSATHFMVNPDGSITAISPPGTGTVDVTVTSSAGTSLTYGGDRFSYVPRPTVVTEAAEALTYHSERLRASVNSDGGTPSNGMGISDCHFEYGTTTSYGLTVPCDSKVGEPRATVQGLTAKTAYHFRIVATNPAGTSYGEDREFTTLPHPPERPTVVTEPPTGSGSILNATVNPNAGTVEDCHFELVLFAVGVTSVPCDPTPGSGETPVAVTAQVSALNPKPGESYYVRIVASNKSGTSNGAFLGPFQFGS